MRRVLVGAVLAAACGDSDAGDGGADDGPGSTQPVDAQCDAPTLTDVDGAVQVATEAELRAALEAGGSVQLTADVTLAAPIEVTAPSVLDGDGHTIDGAGQTHLLVSNATDFTVQNVTLRGGNNRVSDDEHFSRRSGAALLALGGEQGNRRGSLTVVDVVFEDNEIKRTGPGDLRGGALYAFAVPDVTVAGATFLRNVGSNGGAIGGLGSSFAIIDTVFADNEAQGPGPPGALEGFGGAISLDALSQNGQTAYLSICGSRFDNNRANNGGGAIYLVTHAWTGSTVSIEKSVFERNRITVEDNGQGGAIFLMDDSKHEQPPEPVANAAQISDTTFVGNVSRGSGGGMWYLTDDGRLTLTNVTFSGNQIEDNNMGMGGAIAIPRGPLDATNCTFADNWAQFHGGGIQAGGDADVGLRNCLFYNNTSDRDGGWANFHTNREVNRDMGGNMQFLAPDRVIDTNSDALVAAGAVRADAQLDALADNGGPGPTMALPVGSPAIDAGSPDGAPPADGRGIARDDSPDVGAYEAQ